MIDFEKYCNEIKRQYPKTMSKDQFFRVAHISKATALFLLQSGLVPCKDIGKKTHRYTIKTDDVIKYLRERAIYPERYKATEGWYAGTTGGKKQKAEPISCLLKLNISGTKKLEDFFAEQMKDMGDLLKVEELADFVGFRSTSVVNWCSAGKLKSFLISRRYLIPKVCAIKYLASPSMCLNRHQSFKYKYYIAEFRKQHNI